MNTKSARDKRVELEQLSADDLSSYQVERFNALLERILPHNKFFAENWPM